MRRPEGPINELLCDRNRRLISFGVALLPAELLLLTLLPPPPATPTELPGVDNGLLLLTPVAGIMTGLDIMLLFTADKRGDVFNLAGTFGAEGRDGSKK